MAEKKLMVVIAGKVDQFEKAMSGVQKKMKTVSRNMVNMGRGMTTAFTVPIVAAGGAALKFYGDFEQTMTASTAIMGDITESMRKDMELTAREIGKTTRFGAVEAAEAFEFLALAGLDVEQSIAALPQVAAFAQAGNFDLARATDLATDAQAALGLAVDDAAANLSNLTRVTDVLTRAATLANANTEQFSEALTEKTGVALRNVNKDIEEGAAVLAVFADQGVKGGQAGTTLNATLEGLSRQAINNKDGFKALGIEVFDAQGNMKNMADITGDLEKALDGMSTEEQRATLMKLGFNRQALNGIQMLMGNSEAIREYEAELRDAGGTTQDVADKQMANLWDQLGLLKDRLIDSGIVLGEVLGDTIKDVVIPMLDRLVEGVAKLAEWFANLDPFWQKFIIGAAGLLAAVGPLLMMVGTFVGAIANILPLFTGIIGIVGKLGGALVFLATNPIGWIILAIGALITIGILVWKNWDKIKEFFINLWEKLKEVSEKGLEFIKGIFFKYTPIGWIIANWGGIKDWFVNTWNSIKEFFSGFWEGLKESFTTALEFIKGLFFKYHPLGWIIENWDGIKAWFSETWDTIKETFSGALDTIKEKTSTRFEEIKTKAQEVFGSIKDTIGEKWDETSTFTRKTWDGLKNFFGEMWGATKALFRRDSESLDKHLRGAFGGIYDFSLRLWGKLYTYLMDLWDRIKSGVRNKVEDLRSNVVNTIDRALQWIRNIPGKALQWGRDIIQGLINGIRAMGANIGGAIRGVVDGAISSVKSRLGIKSPSEVFKLEVGYQIGAGIAQGVDASERLVSRSLDEIMNVPREIAADYRSSQNVKHTGVIRIEGINDQRELTGVVDIVIDKLLQEVRA